MIEEREEDSVSKGKDIFHPRFTSQPLESARSIAPASVCTHVCVCVYMCVCVCVQTCGVRLEKEGQGGESRGQERRAHMFLTFRPFPCRSLLLLLSLLLSLSACGVRKGRRSGGTQRGRDRGVETSGQSEIDAEETGGRRRAQGVRVCVCVWVCVCGWVAVGGCVW